jgi:hypothetical protein
MVRHLGDGELLALALGESGAEPRAHVAECPLCRSRAAEAEEGLVWARRGQDVPEPSALFWESFRGQVEGRIAEEGAASGGWWSWLGVRWLVPLVGGAALLAILLPRGRGPEPVVRGKEPALPAWSALPPDGEDLSLALLEGALSLPGDGSAEGVDLPALDGCPNMAECVAGLSEDESLALTDALRASWSKRRL